VIRNRKSLAYALMDRGRILDLYQHRSQAERRLTRAEVCKVLGLRSVKRVSRALAWLRREGHLAR
jgi:hypothetical protein